MFSEENPYKPYKVTPQRLRFKEPSAEEKAYLREHKIKAVAAECITLGIFFVICSVLMYYYNSPLYAYIIPVTALLSIICKILFAFRSNYGVFYGTLKHKYRGKNYYLVDLWSAEEKQYCRNIVFRSSKDFDALQDEDKVVVYKINSDVFAELPRSYTAQN